MTYLIVVLVTCLLFFGFLLLTLIESKRGVRLFARRRYLLDKKVSRTLFVFEHVDWGAFTAHLTRTSFEVVAHDVVHGTLLFVRAVERFLTRAVRSLRMRRDGIVPLREPGTSRLDGTVSYLKRNLRRSRKESAAPSPMTDIVRKENGEGRGI